MVIFDKTWWKEHGIQHLKDLHSRKYLAPAYRAQEKALFEVLSKLEYSSILEIGSGNGRLTNQLASTCPEYLATDISQGMLDQIDAPVQKQILDLDDWGLNPLTSFPQYDLVLCVEVLMHRPNQLVIVDLNNMWTVAKKYVILVDWYEPGYKGEAPGCYQHRWTGLADEYPIPEARQSIWVFDKSKGSDAKEETV